MQEMTINTLKDSVTNLKKQLDLLHQQYETAEQEIQTHERCIIQLMEHDNKNKESDTEVMNNESAGNDTDWLVSNWPVFFKILSCMTIFTNFMSFKSALDLIGFIHAILLSKDRADMYNLNLVQCKSVIETSLKSLLGFLCDLNVLAYSRD